MNLEKVDPSDTRRDWFDCEWDITIEVKGHSLLYKTPYVNDNKCILSLE